MVIEKVTAMAISVTVTATLRLTFLLIIDCSPLCLSLIHIFRLGGQIAFGRFADIQADDRTGHLGRRVKTAGLNGEQLVGLGIVAVSYTHLDVYKRQARH